MKTSKIITIIVLILIVFLVIRYVNQTKKDESTNGENAQSVISGLAQAFIPRPILTSVVPGPSAITNSNSNQPFKFGDSIYAKSNTTNAYKNPILSTVNLDSYKAFNANDLIGTFLSTSGIFTKINATNPARIVYVQTSQVYTK